MVSIECHNLVAIEFKFLIHSRESDSLASPLGSSRSSCEERYMYDCGTGNDTLDGN